MRHFFVDEKPKIKGTVLLSVEDSHHLTQVLRRGLGEKLTVSHDDKKYLGSYCGEEGQRVVVKIERELSSEASLPKLILCQGVVKGQKLEEIFQHGTEVGVDHFIPLHMDRTIADIRSKYHKRKPRYEKIIEEAAKQCRRTSIPSLGEIMTLEEVLAERPMGQLIVPYEGQDSGELTKMLDKSSECIYYFIGPEGGFSPREIEALKEAGGKFCSLGPRILRAETAAIVAGFIIKTFLERDGER